jgi:hypothetical protein
MNKRLLREVWGNVWSWSGKRWEVVARGNKGGEHTPVWGSVTWQAVMSEVRGSCLWVGWAVLMSSTLTHLHNMLSQHSTAQGSPVQRSTKQAGTSPHDSCTTGRDLLVPKDAEVPVPSTWVVAPDPYMVVTWNPLPGWICRAAMHACAATAVTVHGSPEHRT